MVKRRLTGPLWPSSPLWPSALAFKLLVGVKEGLGLFHEDFKPANQPQTDKNKIEV